MDVMKRRRFANFGIIFCAWGIGCLPAAAYAAHGVRAAGTVELDVKSEYSHIRVLKQGSLRSLVFVRDNGEEAIETMVNLRTPHELLAPYSRYMFASYFFLPKQERVLMIGLGGGAMVHFCQHYDPEVQMEAVEIDPVVVKIAEKYFRIKPTTNVRIETADGLRYLEQTKTRYDVVYMDAFLKPAVDTDTTGVPRRMKTVQFYQAAQEKLQPEGLMVFNLNVHVALDEDLRTIRSAFAQVYVFRVPGGDNVVAVGSQSEARVKLATLQQRAAEIDRRFKTSFSFREMLRKLEP
jgi:spermidine synthase